MPVVLLVYDFLHSINTCKLRVVTYYLTIVMDEFIFTAIVLLASLIKIMPFC